MNDFQDFHAVFTVAKKALCAIRHAQHPANPHFGAHSVEIINGRRFDAGVPLRHDQKRQVVVLRRLKRPARFFPPNKQRRRQMGKNHGFDGDQHRVFLD